jgi:hypothetical protein
MSRLKRFYDHAVQCGIDMRGRSVISTAHPPFNMRGAWSAIDICDPGTLAVIYPEGYWITRADCLRLFNEWGLDYLVISGSYYRLAP